MKWWTSIPDIEGKTYAENKKRAQAVAKQLSLDHDVTVKRGKTYSGRKVWNIYVSPRHGNPISWA